MKIYQLFNILKTIHIF